MMYKYKGISIAGLALGVTSLVISVTGIVFSGIAMKKIVKK